jgi:hypothetical protein
MLTFVGWPGDTNVEQMSRNASKREEGQREDYEREKAKKEENYLAFVGGDTQIRGAGEGAPGPRKYSSRRV